MSSNSGNVIAALIAGAVVGVGVGMLLAPDKGSSTRKKIKDGFDTSKGELMDKLGELFEGLKEEGQKVVSDVEDVLKRTNPETKDDKAEMIALLEKKLAALKEQK